MLSCESSAVYTMGYCVYFVDKNFSGFCVDESVVWLAGCAFFQQAALQLALEQDILSITLFVFSVILLMCVEL